MSLMRGLGFCFLPDGFFLPGTSPFKSSSGVSGPLPARTGVEVGSRAGGKADG